MENSGLEKAMEAEASAILIRYNEKKDAPIEEARAISKDICEIGLIKKSGTDVEWERVPGIQAGLRTKGVDKDWFSTLKDDHIAETFVTVFSRATPEGQKAFLEKVDFSKHPQENRVAFEELVRNRIEPRRAPQPQTEPNLVTPEAPRRQTKAEILRDLEGSKDPFVEMIKQKAEDLTVTGQANKETLKPTEFTQKTIEDATKIMAELDQTVTHFEKFFPETLANNPTPLLLYKRVKDVRDLATGLQAIYGKKIPREIEFGGRKLNVTEELERRTQNAIGQATLQRWAGKTEGAREIAFPEDIPLIKHDTLGQKDILDWFGRTEASTTRIHERHQFWTETVSYNKGANKTEVVNRKGLLRVEATVKTPDQEDLDYVREVAGSDENTETRWVLLNAAKVEGVGILLHLKPDLAKGLPEQIDKYAQGFPEGFAASPQLKEAQERLRQKPNDEIEKANFRKELFSEWIGLTVTCPEYMAKNFRAEFVTCLTILSDPFERSDIYNLRRLEEANDLGARRYGKDGFTAFMKKPRPTPER